MTARLAGEHELQSLLEKNYSCHPTELGSLLTPPETHFTSENVTLGLERFLLRTNISMSGIEKIEPR